MTRVLTITTILAVLAAIWPSTAEGHHPPGNGWSSYPEYRVAPTSSRVIQPNSCVTLRSAGITDLDVIVLGRSGDRYARPHRTRQVWGGYGTARGSSAWLNHRGTYVVAESVPTRSGREVCTGGRIVRLNVWEDR